VGRSFYMDGGTMRFEDCASRWKGGGLSLQSSRCSTSSCSITQASLAFRSCSSSFGGGLHVNGALGLMQSNASFLNCSAQKEGGGVYVHKRSELTAQAGSLTFKQCEASKYGGGLHHETDAKVRLDKIDVIFDKCTAGKAGGGWDGTGTLTHSRGRMEFQSCKAFRGIAFDTTLGADLDHVKIEMCIGVVGDILSSKGTVAIQHLTFLYGGPSSGFHGEVMAQNISISEVDCVAVHECVLHANTIQAALTCDAASVTMQAGYMLTVPNLSSVANFRELDAVNRTYFCPNEATCPGGRLAYENQTAMCSLGVPATFLAALAQADWFAGQAAFLRDLLLGWGIAIDVFSGQSAVGTPMPCITMAVFGYTPHVTFFWANLALVVTTPLLLVFMLGCMKGFWLGLIVGMNCFLPAVVARVSLLLLVFRPARCDPLQFYYQIPDGQFWGYLLKPVAVLAVCFTGATCLWLRAVRSDQKPALHVLYLAAPYKPEFAAWEVERLIRKMTLGMLSAVFPVTLHPLFQLESVALVLILSAALYYKSRPYTQEKFNETEIGLLGAAITMTVFTVMCVVPTKSWATSIPGLKLAGGVAAVVVVMGGTAWMAMSICAAIIEERRKEY
ncbi:unnamed protein product, partial [Symbiodinium sp. CCMP2592]